MIFGDHGMVEVTQLIDLRGLIEKARLDKNEDAYFLDSTFARFWVADPDRKEKLITLLNGRPGGHVLTDDEIYRYRIRYPHNYFGNVIYVVDDGALIHPSYYSVDKTPPKGMHGYLPGCRDNESAFILSTRYTEGLGNLGRVDMQRIFPTVLEMLGLNSDCDVPHNLKSIIP